jgi:hypothetical protein
LNKIDEAIIASAQARAQRIMVGRRVLEVLVIVHPTIRALSDSVAKGGPRSINDPCTDLQQAVRIDNIVAV